MGIRENIRRFRKAADLTQEQLAEKLGIARSTVTQWESGWSQPRMGMVENLAHIFGVSIADLVSEDVPYMPPFSNVIKARAGEFVPVPLVGRVHAGKPVETENLEESERQVNIPRFILDSDPDTYVMVSEGDCMNRVYPEGCVIAISPHKKPQNGSVVVVTIDGVDTVMRRMYKTSQTLILAPDSFNGEHKDIIITSDDDHVVDYCGKVVWFQSKEVME